MAENEPKTGSFKAILPQLITVLSAASSSISHGMHYGWSAPAIPILTSKDTPLKISKADETWLETVYLIGGVTGLPMTMYLVDKIGRKKSIILASCISLISWILIAIPSKVSIYIGRYFCGIGGDVSFVAIPMYIAEIADQKNRGLLSSIGFLMMLSGIVLIYCVAPFTPYYVPSIIGIILISIHLITFNVMPESPYYLLAKNRVQAAQKSLNKLRAKSCNNLELEEIRAAVERQKREKGGMMDLLRTKSNRKAMIIIGMLTVTQHFSGLSVMMMNMHSILAEAGSIYLHANRSAILYAVSMLVSATVGSFLVDKCGRRMVIIISTILTSICLLVLAVYFNLKHVGYDLQRVSWIPIAAVMTYAAVFQMGFALVPTILVPEIFSNKVKAVGMTTSVALYFIFGFLSIEVYKNLSESFGFHILFYLFSIMAFFTTLFCFFVLPETKGKSLEEIQKLLGAKIEVLECDNNGTLLKT